MSKVTRLKIKQPDGSFSSDIDLGAKASNIVLTDGTTAETKFSTLDTNINNINTNFNTYTNTTNNRLDSIEAKISSVYKIMGSINTYADLAAKEATAEIGDVWNVLDTGENYAWTGTEWDDLGGTVDLSNYYNKEQTYSKTEVDEKISGETVKLTGDQTINGTKTFGVIPVLPATAPTENNQAVSKSYVDTSIENAKPNIVWATTSDINALF